MFFYLKHRGKFTNRGSGLRFIHVIMPYKNTREIDEQKVDVTVYLYIDPCL
jgi:hypothetical protein